MLSGSGWSASRRLFDVEARTRNVAPSKSLSLSLHRIAASFERFRARFLRNVVRVALVQSEVAGEALKPTRMGQQPTGIDGRLRGAGYLPER